MLLVAPETWLKKKGYWALSATPPKMCNELLVHIRLFPCPPVFKSSLKTHFYSLAFIPDKELYTLAPMTVFFLFTVWLFDCMLFYTFKCIAFWSTWLFLNVFYKIKLNWIGLDTEDFSFPYFSVHTVFFLERRWYLNLQIKVTSEPKTGAMTITVKIRMWASTLMNDSHL